MQTNILIRSVSAAMKIKLEIEIGHDVKTHFRIKLIFIPNIHISLVRVT